MAKPSRRERRRLAEQGKSVARRVPPTAVPRGAAIEPRERFVASPTPGAEQKATPARVATVRPGEYAHVKSDLLRIGLLAAALFGGMLALRFILPP